MSERKEVDTSERFKPEQFERRYYNLRSYQKVSSYCPTATGIPLYGFCVCFADFSWSYEYDYMKSEGLNNI